VSWDWSPADLSALQAFLVGHGLGSGPVTTTPIGDGHSNLTYLVSVGEHRVVVRRPPPPPVPPGAHDVLREAALLRGVGDSDVPVPAVLATAGTGEVLDDVPLAVLEFVAGPVVTTTTPAALATPSARRAIGESMVDTLVALHAVDWRAAGLEGMGRPEGFNGRHLRRLRPLVADAQDRLPPGFDDVEAWLSEHVPAESGATIVHNDFRLGNVILAPEPPGRVAAVLDWELATLGDPLFDVGYFLACWPVAGVEPTPTEAMATAVLEPGWPSRDELAEHYARASGRDLDGLPWYTTLALWKLAVLYEYSRRQAVDPYYDDPALVRSFLEAAHRAAGL
jgi:aminoglycoside phosphotransferase (APT) family kinase protein